MLNTHDVLTYATIDYSLWANKDVVAERVSRMETRSVRAGVGCVTDQSPKQRPMDGAILV